QRVLSGSAWRRHRTRIAWRGVFHPDGHRAAAARHPRADLPTPAAAARLNLHLGPGAGAAGDEVVVLTLQRNPGASRDRIAGVGALPGPSVCRRPQLLARRFRARSPLPPMALVVPLPVAPITLQTLPSRFPSRARRRAVATPRQRAPEEAQAVSRAPLIENNSTTVSLDVTDSNDR